MKQSSILLGVILLLLTTITRGDSPTTQPLAPDVLAEIQIAFRSAVFAGDEFPAYDFTSPHLVHEVLGHCKLCAKFYDSAFNEVDAPTSPGRYGAIVTVTSDHGQPFQRFITLFHEPARFIWRDKDLHLSMQFPQQTGLLPEVADQQHRLVNHFITHLFSDSFSRPSTTAAFFAGLYETQSDPAPLPLRNSPDERDAIWWYHLKQKTGDLVPLKYLTFLPKTYNANNDKWPLVLFLHGSGERGDDPEQLKAWAIPRMGAMGNDMPFIAICPQCPAGEHWLATQLIDFLDKEILPKYRVDKSRQYITGLSMGGFGTYSLIQQFPDRFAAAIPICGIGDPHDVARIKNIPIWIFHGGADDTVPVEASREMNAALKGISVSVRYTEFPGVGHVSWEKAYATPELFPWMLAQHLAH